MKFDQKYNHDAFAAFLRDFLPEDYVENEKDIADLSRCKIISKARELGHSPSLDVYVLEMTHAKETDPRVSIATDAFKILATFGYDKALVIFKNDESENYRFSYLTISLDLNEKNKVIAKYSNAHRYSFYLGTGAKTKTPEQQLVKRGRVKDVGDLLSRFSLEVVNKQFYLEIAKFFDELVDEQDANLALPFQSDPTVRKNFAMRLIGRLMFCWFLKQKKSNDGALVSDELLSASAVKDSYYHAILEPLFFEILNTQIDERDIRSDVCDKVPYLNGGLFSPQHDDYYELDRATFTSRHVNTLRVADAWFRDFFALLETYNFTIDENTVFDQELSVDPEMLGRIFENLLAEINPDTGSSERKRTGSYYTPRQVVEYMVDQSLTEYLKTATSIDEKRLAALVSYDLGDDEGNQLTAVESKKVVAAIENLKILDPACGSGAFPIGALQKIVWILQRVDPQCDLWLGRKLEEVPELYRKKITDYFQNNPPDYIRKLDVIKDSIFGVDIQPIAVEMSRLRCFLTLVVESEINDTKKNRGIEPLPNLDFKFVCANTLVGLPKKGSIGLFEDHSGIEELSAIMSDYFSSSNQRKAEIRQRFTNTQKDILNRSLSSFGKTTGELTMRLSLWDPFSSAPSPWFDPEWMFGLDHRFDIVIGNPPYIRVDSLDKNLKEIYKEQYVSAKGKYDLYYLFYESGIRALDQNGVLTFITPNKYCAADSAITLRNLIIDNNYVEIVSTSMLNVFGDAANYPVITRIRRNVPNPELVCREAFSLYNISASTQNAYTLKQEETKLLPYRVVPINVTRAEISLVIRLLGTGKTLGSIINFSEGLRIKVECEVPEKDDHPIVKQFQFEKWTPIRDGAFISEKNLSQVLSTTSDRYKKIMQEKILIAEDGLKINAALDTENHIPQGGIYFGAAIDNLLMLGLLNSRLLSCIYQILFGGMHMGGGYLRYRKTFLESLPLPQTSIKGDILMDIRETTQKILLAYKEDSGKVMLDLETHLDKLVLDLYGLSDEERSLI